MKLSSSVSPHCLIKSPEDWLMKMDWAVSGTPTLAQRQPKQSLLVLYATLLFIIPHNNVLLNENEFPITDQILLNDCSAVFHDLNFFFLLLFLSLGQQPSEYMSPWIRWVGFSRAIFSGIYSLNIDVS